MTSPSFEIVDKATGRLTRWRARVSRGPRDPGIYQAYQTMAKVYRGFIQQRWRRYSSGGGDWIPKKAKGRILRDTDTMYSSVEPVFVNAPGQFQKALSDGILVGIGGGARHPKAMMPVSTLAAIHQTGAGVVPVRKIIVKPPRRVAEQMSKILKKAHAKIYNRRS